MLKFPGLSTKNRFNANYFIHFDSTPYFAIFLICVGILLRLSQYFFNRSLWLDEAFIATNFLYKPWGEILRPPMDYSATMMVPIGFMATTKIMTTLFGNNDMTLRLFPLLVSLISIPLFYKLAGRILPTQGVLAAVYLFCLSSPLIYQSSEFKPYTNDVAFIILAAILPQSTQDGMITTSNMTLWAVFGAAAVWFSFPSAFVLASVGTYLILEQAKQKKWKIVFGLVAVSAVWLASFAWQYRLSTGDGVENSAVGQWIIQFWDDKGAFMPPLSPFDKFIEWLVASFINLFLDPGGWIVMIIPAYLFLSGCIFMFIRNRRAFFFLIFPAILAAAASHFQLYPFSGRMLFFFLPAILLMIAEGITRFASLLKHPALIVAAQIVLLAALTNYRPGHHTRQEMKLVLEYVQIHMQPQDTLYIFYAAEPAFRYYASTYGFDYHRCNIIVPIPKKEHVDEIDYFRSKLGLRPVSASETNCILGTSALLEPSIAELEKIKHTKQRVWFIFSHAYWTEDDFVKYLNQSAKQLDKIIQVGSAAYLYEMP